MPELPEVETIRRALAPRLHGRTLVAAESHPSDKFTPAHLAVGSVITDVGRRGKYLLLALDVDRELVIHLGMTGSISIGDGPVDDPYMRASWQLDDGDTMAFRDVRRFGRIRVVPLGDHSSIPTLAAAGPEPFDDTFDGAHLYRALRSSSRRVKTQLLSQRPVAGIGNIYADEALWLASVHPARRRITKAQADALAEAIVEVLEAGVDHGGTTLRDYRNLDGGTGANQYHLHCYGRAGQPCERCHTPLRSKVIDARTSTWCPRCQAS
ncbi:MAG: bifunctional DNA-formamidopyrimidine glycosylase/DNA-(apurinic or apyrimidinic site) lyase [Acidimicrobiia bacterium]|nr:bifunctional DNA-formamidopyrimidine glycosylase/DNA-(apurinic or apyrimidinic site) lyase [Acidimicrobiia bacterium]